jgi:hypothetical protein
LLRGSGDIGAMLSTCWGVCQVDKGDEQNLRGKPQTEGFSAQSAVSDPGTAFYRRNRGVWALFRCRSVLGLQDWEAGGAQEIAGGRAGQGHVGSKGGDSPPVSMPVRADYSLFITYRASEYE